MNKVYITPDFEIINIKLTADVLSASQPVTESEDPFHPTGSPSEETEPFFEEGIN